MIFDKIRKKEIILYPEEKVRQWLIKYFIEELGYPRCLFSVERGINNLNQKKYRTDVVVYNKYLQPLILVECKASQINITENSLRQVLKYNKIIKAKYIVISNKIKTYCWFFNEKKDEYNFTSVPKYSEIKDLFI